MVQRFAFSDLALKGLKAPETGNDYLWDTVQERLGIRVGAGGAKTFVVLIVSGRRKALGRYPALTLSEARRAAKKTMAEITLGKVHPTHTAFDDVVAAFLENASEENKPRTVSDYKRLLKKHYPFGRSSIAEVTPRDVLLRLAPLNSTPSEKHHAFSAGRALFRWAVRNQFLDRSPMDNLATPSGGKPRERVLSTGELVAAYKAAGVMGYPFGNLVQLLILLGQRRGEIASLRWDWIGTKTIHFPASIAKNGRENPVPLTPMADAILRGIPRLSEYVFPATKSHVSGKPTTVYNGFTKDAPALRKLAAIDHFTLHDLRRSVSSQMAALGVPQVVVEKLLNHVSGGTMSPIAQVYNRYNYQPELLEALTRYHAYLQEQLLQS